MLLGWAHDWPTGKLGKLGESVCKEKSNTILNNPMEIYRKLYWFPSSKALAALSRTGYLYQKWFLKEPHPHPRANYTGSLQV